MEENKLKKCWEDIPVGRANAASYETLCKKWGVSRRQARSILQELSLASFDCKYVLIRSSHGAGFYKTDDPEDIKSFRLECLSRGRACLAPVSKINRVLHDQPYGGFDLLTALDQMEASAR